MVEIRRRVIAKSRVDLKESERKQDVEDRRPDEESLKCENSISIQKIAGVGKNLIQSIVNPCSGSEKVAKVFEEELAFISEFGKRANRDRSED